MVGGNVVYIIDDSQLVMTINDAVMSTKETA